MAITQRHTFDRLIDNVYQTHCLMQQTAHKAINYFLVIKNWLTGYYIVEYEQNGEDRAKYDEQLIDEMSKSLKLKGLKGYSQMSLRTYRKFYRAYPQIQQSITVELQKTGNEIYKHLPFNDLQIQQSPTIELTDAYPISNEILLSRLSYTHFVELMRAKEPLERLFYEVETIKNNWSVKQLERAFDTGLYVRTGLSVNKEAVIAKFKNQMPAQNADVIRDPYWLEFIGLEERSEYSESELEQAILNHLQQFLRILL